jgi:hypothetical protein
MRAPQPGEEWKAKKIRLTLAGFFILSFCVNAYAEGVPDLERIYRNAFAQELKWNDITPREPADKEFVAKVRTWMEDYHRACKNQTARTIDARNAGFHAGWESTWRSVFYAARGVENWDRVEAAIQLILDTAFCFTERADWYAWEDGRKVFVRPGTPNVPARAIAKPRERYIEFPPQSVWYGALTRQPEVDQRQRLSGMINVESCVAAANKRFAGIRDKSLLPPPEGYGPGTHF